MSRDRIPAVFIRGGSSKGVFFHQRDLPRDPGTRDALFLRVLGSPDPYGRQLDGMGGGLSSVSKAVIIAPSARDDADVDYTFAQVSVDRPVVDYSATCGNLSSAVGPFAVDEGLLQVPDGEATVRVFNTNTRKVYHARFLVASGQAVEAGGFSIPGVSGGGAPVALDYIDPGGAATGRLLPTGNVRDILEVPGIGAVEVSMVDATSGVVFVEAAAMGSTALEPPETIDADAPLLQKLEAIRRAAAVAMGLAGHPDDAALAAPRVALVAPPSAFKALDGTSYEPDSHDLNIRILSMEKCHRAVTLTGAMCTGVAAHIPGTLPNAVVGGAEQVVRIGNPSGVLPVEGDVVQEAGGGFSARSATVYRTQRRLMEGHVLVPEGRPEPAISSGTDADRQTA